MFCLTTSHFDYIIVLSTVYRLTYNPRLLLRGEKGRRGYPVSSRYGSLFLTAPILLAVGVLLGVTE